MFERFTPRARRAIVLAQDAAREMGHAQIKPEHLLVGLRRGEGLAANAMAHAGVDAVALRHRVDALYESKPSAKHFKKVPFSVEGKKCLELSLRAALALGHNYIGTEHLFFGVQRQAEAHNRSLDDLLGVPADEIHHRLTEMLGNASSGTPARSPALQSALDRARALAGGSPITTGQVLTGMLADPDNQVSRALTVLGIDSQALQTAVDAVDLSETSDASPLARSIAITIGETTTVIADADLATALQHLDSEQLRDLITKAIERPDSGRAAG